MPPQPVPNASAPPYRAVPARGSRFGKRLLLAGLFAAAIGGGYLVGGFLRFTQEVAEFSRLPDSARADGIVVLTGGSSRLDQAIELLKSGKARRLLISGVNPGTSAGTLSKLTATDRHLFDCCVDLDYAALNTVGNAEMTEAWARRQGFDDVIVVTSDYHMPRTLLEFERFAPVPAIRPHAVVRSDLWRGDSIVPTARGAKILVVEYAKLLATRLRFAFGVEGRALAGGPTEVANRTW